MSKIISVASGGEEQLSDVLPVARMISSLMKEEKWKEDAISKFEENFIEQVEKEDYWAIFHEYTHYYDLVIKQQDKKGTKADKIETYFSTLIYLWSQMPSLSKLEAAVDRVRELIASADDFPQMRLKMLMISYNAIPVTQKTAAISKSIFFSLTEFADRNQLFADLVPYLSYFEEWVASWKLEGTTDLRDLCFFVANSIPTLTADQLSTLKLRHGEDVGYVWLRKYLENEVEVRPESLKAISTFVQQIVRLPMVFQIEGLLDIQVIKLAAQKDAKVAKMQQLLELFVSGSIDDLEKFEKANPTLFAEMEITHDQVANKLRILTMCSICEGRTEVPLKELQTKLKTEAVEDLIISATHYDVLVGRIDEVNQVLKVQCVLQRRFGKKEWENLDKMLDAWTQKIRSLKKLHAQRATMGGA